MRKAEVTVNFAGKTGKKIKPLHGVNNSPVSLYKPPKGFREAGIPFSRLHDTAGAYGGAHYVDIPNVFPDFDADPKDPGSYDFAFTDAYLKQLDAAGTKIFYRLGVTIENNYGIKGYHNHPPKDFRKWAEICAGVVRHYNCGWAGGLKLGIQYWEIWNEPENPPMWSGTREQYFELYRITSKRLKKEFPEIRVGGYASCGFYAVNRPGCTDFFKSFVSWYDDFLKFVTAKKTACPLDFFSWHLYTSDPEEIILHAGYVDSKLKEFGLEGVENIFNEWNYTAKDPADRFSKMKTNEGAAFVGSAFCLMQDSPIDKAMYYDGLPSRKWCGLYFFPSEETTPTYSVFRMWNRLYSLGRQCPAETSGANVCACAGSDKAVLISNFSTSGCQLSLALKGAQLKDFNGWIIDKRHDNVPFALKEEVVLPPHSVLLLTTEKKSDTAPVTEQNGPVIHAGLHDPAAEKKKKK